MRALSLVALLTLFLVGCAKIPTVTPPPKKEVTAPEAQNRWHEHAERAANLGAWQAKGRLAISHQQKGTNASFVWQQFANDHYQIKLFGPFGSGAVYITGYPTYVELKDANGKVTRARSPEVLLKKATGWNLPITGLVYWLRGLPTPHSPIQSERLDNQGILQHLSQQGWFIRYENYHTDNALPLPNKMQLQNRDLKVKLVITAWQL